MIVPQDYTEDGGSKQKTVQQLKKLCFIRAVSFIVSRMFISKNLIVEKRNNRFWLDNSERPRENCKDYDFCIGDWNVLSMYRTGMLKQNWNSIELILQQLKR